MVINALHIEILDRVRCHMNVILSLEVIANTRISPWYQANTADETLERQYRPTGANAHVYFCFAIHLNMV